MLTCDNEKVGIFHKLDYFSLIVESTSHLTQLFINNCTIDGEVLANSLDNSESVVLLHLSNMKWRGKVFYDSSSFVKNKRITVSVCNNNLPDHVVQNLINSFDSASKISRIMSSDDVFIAHNCSYELVRWHLTQEVSCDPLKLFYICNCPMTTDLDWFENYFQCQVKMNEIVLQNNDFSRQSLDSVLSIVRELSVKKIFIIENALNCNWAARLLFEIPCFTIAGRNMIISVGGVSKHISRAINVMSQSSCVIRLINCKLDSQSFESLTNIIYKCNKLQEFTLSCGDLSAIEESNCFRLLEASSQIKLLTHFNFDNHKSSAKTMNGVSTVINSNTQLEELRLNNLDLKVVNVLNIFAIIGGLNYLKVLSLNGNILSEKAEAHLSAALTKKPTLHFLCLANASLKTDLANASLKTEGVIEIANALQTIKTLKLLMLSDKKITGAASESIAAAITNNTGLEKLYLDNNFLGEQGYKNVVKALKHLVNLKVLHLKNNKFQCNIADFIQDLICTNKNVEKISFGNNYLYTKGKKIHCNFIRTQIKSIGVSGNKITSKETRHIADIVSNSAKIERLQVSDNSLGTEGCNIIATALKSICTLTKLYISNNNITEQAADGIAEVVSRNISLQVLDIGNNLLLSTGIIKVAKALRELHNVKELCLDKNFITKEAADDIAAVICSNARLEKLQLNDNLLKTEGANIICSALKQLSCLKVIMLCNNHISWNSADFIALIIKNNPFIETLALGHNKLQSAGATIIAKALQYNCNLKSLDLENNQISFEAASDIAEAISRNAGLEKLWLHHNILGTGGVICISKALEKIAKLKLYRIDNNNITDEAVDSMVMVISEHFSFLEAVWISEDKMSPSAVAKFTGQLKMFTSLVVSPTLFGFELLFLIKSFLWISLPMLCFTVTSFIFASSLDVSLLVVIKSIVMFMNFLRPCRSSISLSVKSTT